MKCFSDSAINRFLYESGQSIAAQGYVGGDFWGWIGGLLVSLIEESAKPPRKHGIVLADDGRLLVNISLDLFHRFALDEADMRKSPSEIIAVIEPMLTATLSVLERHATIHDDGREWMGDIELSDGQIAVGEALTGNTVFLRLGELKLEFHRVTGAGITAPELSIAKHELYRIHPVTYQMRQEQNRAVRFTDLGIPTDPPPPV